MAFLTLLKKQFTPTKLLFHFLFWVFHWGIFAYGWYAFPSGGSCGEKLLSGRRLIRE